MYPSSVVHTGVKSFGCENSTAQEFSAVPLFAPDIVPFKGTNRRNYPPGLTHRAVSFSGDAGLSEVRELG